MSIKSFVFSIIVILSEVRYFIANKKTQYFYRVVNYYQNKCKTNFKIKSKGTIKPQPTL